MTTKKVNREDQHTSLTINHNVGFFFVMDVRWLVTIIAITTAASFGVGFFSVPNNHNFVPISIVLSSSSSTNTNPSDRMVLGTEPQRRRHKNNKDDDDDDVLYGGNVVVVPDATTIHEHHESLSSSAAAAPSGHHLLIDMKNVNEEFLNSEEQLIEAMMGTAHDAGLTILSYHCHTLDPSGVSCVGILLENHMSFHTWPSDGVITIDIFTCGGPKNNSNNNSDLLPVVTIVERWFGRKLSTAEHDGTDDDEGIIITKWAHELRGFDHPAEKGYLDDSSDLGLMVLSPLDVHQKKQIYSHVTKYQRIDIWDLVDGDDTPTFEDVIYHNLHPDDPRWLTPDLTTPERMLFLDGTLQSSSHSDHEYHEALVHPAMFTHPNPRRVAIIGGGEGATLREVLKHQTIEAVTMIEIDEELVAIARQHLPYMSDCSDLLGRANNCFDDNLVSIVFDDAREWFITNHGEHDDGDGDDDTLSPRIRSEPSFDVIIVDALDPEDSGSIADKLYSDIKFISSVVRHLTEDGVLLIQIGTPPFLHDPRPDMGIYWQREILFNILEELPEIEAMMVYEEAHCGFNEPHSFLVSCRSADCRSQWYADVDVVDFRIYDRTVRTHSEKRALLYYDGTLQHYYQATPKAWETVYCRRDPVPFECSYRHLDPSKEFYDFHLNKYVDGDDDYYTTNGNSFRIVADKNDQGDVIQTYVYATVDIPQGSYIMPSHLSTSLFVADKTVALLEANVEVQGAGRVAVIEDLLEFMNDFGHESIMNGLGTYVVEVGASHTIRKTSNVSYANVGRWIPSHPTGQGPKFSPVYDRHRQSFDVFLVATTNISKGTEILRYERLWS